MVSLQCLFFGVTLVCVSLIGDYIARIYEESKGRPLYVVNRAVNVTGTARDTARAVFLAPRTVESPRTAEAHQTVETPIHANRV